MHPLLNDLSQYNMDELMSRHNDLHKKIMSVSRTGSTAVLPQMHMILQAYRDEIYRRNQKNFEDVRQKNPQFKNIIDIK